MKEVEVKARIADKEAIIKKLESLGCKFSEPITQHDQIYVTLDVDFPDVKTGQGAARIRRQFGDKGDKILLTLKQVQKNQLDKIEHEVEISDAKEMDAILRIIGYRLVSEVKKVRRKTKYQGDEICVDEVEGLGSFMEMERLAEEGDSDQIQAELFSFLKTLGIKDSDRVFDSYDIMAYKQKK